MLECYSSNIRNLVSDGSRLIGLKSHDCHALMQHLLPVVIRHMNVKHVRVAITRLCFFFRELCQKTIDPSKLDPLQREIVHVLCLFEMKFPPSFFDSMLHLTVHLVREVQLGGPVYLRWMYGFERLMKVYKGYVRHRNRPEGCIAESYIAEEGIEFCSDYIGKTDPVGVPKARYVNTQDGRTIGGGVATSAGHADLKLAHRNVLENTSIVEPYAE